MINKLWKDFKRALFRDRESQEYFRNDTIWVWEGNRATKGKILDVSFCNDSLRYFYVIEKYYEGIIKSDVTTGDSLLKRTAE